MDAGTFHDKSKFTLNFVICFSKDFSFFLTYNVGGLHICIESSAHSYLPCLWYVEVSWGRRVTYDLIGYFVKEGLKKKNQMKFSDINIPQGKFN